MNTEQLRAEFEALAATADDVVDYRDLHKGFTAGYLAAAKSRDELIASLKFINQSLEETNREAMRLLTEEQIKLQKRNELIVKLVKALTLARKRVEYLGIHQTLDKHYIANQRDFLPQFDEALAEAKAQGYGE